MIKVPPENPQINDTVLLQGLKAVTAYFSSKQLLPFGFVEQSSRLNPATVIYRLHGWLSVWNILKKLIWDIPANTRRSAIVGLMLGHRLRRWPNIKPTLAEGLVFSVSPVRKTASSYRNGTICVMTLYRLFRQVEFVQSFILWEGLVIYTTFYIFLYIGQLDTDCFFHNLGSSPSGMFPSLQTNGDT